MSLLARVLRVRRATMQLADGLGPEDWVAQSMPDASPVKWHLAHTTWFFERFVLRPLGIAPVDPRYDYLFNSYYETVGARHPRPKRGLLTRPTADEIVAYRQAVDARLADLAESPRLPEVAQALELGANHEEQHQELLLTDLKHLFSENPLAPCYRGGTAKHDATAPPLAFRRFEGGLVRIGWSGGDPADTSSSSFSFDNERPSHQVFVQPFALASRLVTCGEFLDFILDGGHRRPELWLSYGWAWVNGGGHRAPLYWDVDARTLFTLAGTRPIAWAEPVCHVTYYEADAFARWAGARLPREAEWELAARDPVAALGTFAEDAAFHPRAAEPGPLAQMLGDAWVWTQSAYEPYPGFVPLSGAFAEYNGKFMVNQLTLRGASCVTPREHARITYRNFFPPSAAWQFTGIRLAKESS